MIDNFQTIMIDLGLLVLVVGTWAVRSSFRTVEALGKKAAEEILEGISSAVEEALKK